MAKRVHNFNPGPAALPLPVLEKARDEMTDWAGTGMSVMEVSHRSKEYDKLHHESMALVKELMGFTDEYKVLWLQGGASTQFYMVPQNLYQAGKPMEYVVTGEWAKKALKEAKLFGETKAIASSEDQKYSFIPKELPMGANASFLHITGNNTIYGTEYNTWPKAPDGVPLVVDMSSNLMDQVIDAKRFALLYAGAQKNLGPAGVTLVVVRDDMLKRTPEKIPTMCKYSVQAEKESLYNTPPCWAIYICKLVLDYNKSIGGIAAIEKVNREKAKLIYNVIDASGGYYRGHAKPDSRSMMNITFRLPNEPLEEKFASEAKGKGLIGLKGHRDVGGMRASLYNAVSLDSTKLLAEFMKEFQSKNQ